MIDPEIIPMIERIQGACRHTKGHTTDQFAAVTLGVVDASLSAVIERLRQPAGPMTVEEIVQKMPEGELRRLAGASHGA